MEVASNRLGEDELKRINEMYKKFQQGDEKLLQMKNETGVMVLGKSNIGKTTLCHLIHKSKLKVVDNFGMFAINLEDPNSTDAKIGMEGISCTAIPNYFKLKVGDKTLNLYDCPGFCDSNKFESLISNCYYVYNTFLNIPQNLFVLVVLEDELRGGTARGFIQSVELFLKLFEIASDNTEAGVPDSAKKKITLQEIASRTLLVMTKSRLHVQKVIGLIQNFVVDRQKNEIGEFMKFFLKEDKIEVIKEADLGKPLPDQNVANKLNSFPYLNRKGPDGHINMNVIKHRLAESELEPSEKQLAARAFSRCHEDILQLITNLYDALIEIKSNYLTDKYQYKFFSAWHKAFNDISSDKTKKNTTLKRPSVYPHFSTLKLIEKAYKTLDIDTKNKDNFTTEKTQKIILSIIESIAELLPMNTAEFEILLKVIYLVNRKYEESKVLQKIKDDLSPPNRSHLDKIRSFLEEKFEDVEKKWTNQYVVKTIPDLTYYDEAIAIFSKYKAVDKELLKKISACQMEKGNIRYNERKWIQAIKYYVEALETGQTYSADANKTNYVLVDINLYTKIAQLCFYNVNCFKYALIFYKVINNAAMVLQCYQQLIKTNAEDSYKLRIEMGDYLVTVIEFEKAITIFKMASDAVNSNELKAQAHQKMIATYKNKENFFQAFQAKVNAKEFYNRLPADFDKNKMFTDLTAAASTASSILSSDLVVNP